MTQTGTNPATEATFVLDGRTILLSGCWIAGNLPRQLPLETESLEIDTASISALDGIGAAAIARCFPAAVLGAGVESRHRTLLEHTFALDIETTKSKGEFAPLTHLGREVTSAVIEITDVIDVQGRLTVAALKACTPAGRMRVAAFVHQFQETVLRAIPIVCLISLVVGVILTQQSILQLRTFGATVFVVDLAGILMLREVGVILAAIMVAGRSGSAFAAEIGAMRMREEIDALEVMGLDPFRMVVLPRAAALIAGMPALALLAAMSGIVGAAIVARLAGGVSFEIFSTRLASIVDLRTVVLGVVKAPFMALAITVIAVREGMRVSGSTESLGRHTTSAVVKSIFAVILIDGIFAVYYGALEF